MSTRVGKESWAASARKDCSVCGWDCAALQLDYVIKTHEAVLLSCIALWLSLDEFVQRMSVLRLSACIVQQFECVCHLCSAVRLLTLLHDGKIWLTRTYGRCHFTMK
jgi:hypothetical protein